MPVLPTEELQKVIPAFSGKIGGHIIDGLRKLLRIDKVSEAYDSCDEYSGGEHAYNLLKYLQVDYRVGGVTDFLPEFADKPFITVSNHPYGGIDGLILADFFTRVNPAYKLIVNKVLSHIKALMPACFVVDPSNNDSKGVTKTNIVSIRKTMEHVREGRPLGIFPAGAVSDFSIKDWNVRDREWQEGMLRAIRKLEVPVIPVRFFDRNSNYFYFLGLINWKIRTLRLPGELFNKAGKRCRVGIGSPIRPEKLSEFNSTKELGNFLRKSVYEMEPSPDFRDPSSILPRSENNFA